jgi:hypothetical protein
MAATLHIERLAAIEQTAIVPGISPIAPTPPTACAAEVTVPPVADTQCVAASVQPSFAPGLVDKAAVAAEVAVSQNADTGTPEEAIVQPTQPPRDMEPTEAAINDDESIAAYPPGAVDRAIASSSNKDPAIRQRMQVFALTAEWDAHVARTQQRLVRGTPCRVNQPGSKNDGRVGDFVDIRDYVNEEDFTHVVVFEDGEECHLNTEKLHTNPEDSRGGCCGKSRVRTSRPAATEEPSSRRHCTTQLGRVRRNPCSALCQ